MFYNAALEKVKTTVRVPKGTSSYQAAWILDTPISDDDEGSESEDDSMMVR